MVSPSPLLQESVSMSLRNPTSWSSNYLPVFQPNSVYSSNSGGGPRTNSSIYFHENHPPPQSNQRSSSHAFNHGEGNIILKVYARNVVLCINLSKKWTKQLQINACDVVSQCVFVWLASHSGVVYKMCESGPDLTFMDCIDTREELVLTKRAETIPWSCPDIPISGLSMYTVIRDWCGIHVCV